MTFQRPKANNFLTHSQEPPDTKSEKIGLKAIALYEAAKGALVLAIGLGLLSVIHQDLQTYGERIVRHLHMNPARHYPKIFIDGLSQLSPDRLHLMIAGALFYAAVRFIEAYGLWTEKKWAEWFAIISSGAYLPLEIYEFVRHPKKLTLVLTLLNAAFFFFLIKYRLSKRVKKDDRPKPSSRV